MEKLTSPVTRQDGFTLVEVLTAMVLATVLMTLAATALRTYWLNRSVLAARAEVVAEMRRVQAQAVSESHPLSFGIRVKVGSSDWDVVRYDPGTDLASVADDTCTSTPRKFSTGVVVSAASFDPPPGITVSKCPQASGSAFAFFYARGTATAGDLTVRQPAVSRTESLRVIGLTGKVREL
jgi:prepilin-type N-terminal cleavage/methylation domain-containing protein